MKISVVTTVYNRPEHLRLFLAALQIQTRRPDEIVVSDDGSAPDSAAAVERHLASCSIPSKRIWEPHDGYRLSAARNRAIRAATGVELEVFVHGALCMAYSGRCLLSGYINKRDPNQGTCTNACRWEYKTHEAKEDELGNSVHLYAPIAVQQVETQGNPTLGVGAPTDKVFLLEDVSRPGEFMEATEDEHGTYIMNSKDLRAVQHVERLVQMGVHSLKIEGRTKSHYYVARTAQVYRKAIDDAVAGRPFDRSLMDTLESLAHRGYTEGFLRRHVHDEYQNYERGFSLSERQQFVGELTGERRNGLAEVRVKNRFAVGDRLELMTPQGNLNLRLEALENSRGEAIEVAPGDGHTVYLAVPEDVDLHYALLMRELDGGTTRG
jgi:putative protease